MHEMHVAPQRQFADVVVVASAEASAADTEVDISRILERLA
jgi:hypothetical protein